MPDSTGLSRRQLLRLSAGALLLAGWPGALRAKDPAAGAFSFLAINDLHFVDAGCTPFFERLVKQLKTHLVAGDGRPEFCLLLGDLADAGKPEQFDPLRSLFKTLNIPIHVVIGNHDYRPDGTAGGNRQAYEQAFPRALNYTFEHQGWQFVGLDTSEAANAIVSASPATLDFADQMRAKLDKSRPLVLFTHFPLGPDVTNRVKNADALLDRFKDHNLRAVFSGHHHGFTERQVRGATLTTNRCCSFRRNNHDGTKEKGYFVCRAEGMSLTRTFVEMAAAEGA